MRKIRLIALSLATVILLAFVIPIFTPALSNNVYASGDVIEVETYNALKTALSDFSNKNKTIKLSSSIETNEVICIRFPVTIDLNKKSMNLGPESYIEISTNNKDDTVTITGNGYIGGEYTGSGGILYVNTGTLVFESGTVENKPQSNGTPFDLLNKTCCYILVYSGIFISKYEWIDKVSYSLISYYYWDKDDDTGFTTSYIDYRFQVAGEIVNHYNCKDILGDGVFSYDYDTRTLAINGDGSYDNDPERFIISSYVPGLTIDVQGPSSLIGCLDLYRSTTITGNNKLTVTSNKFAACIQASDLLIKDVSIEFKGTSGGISIYDENSLIIVNSLIIDNSEDESIIAYGIFELKDCKIVEPEKYDIADGTVYDSKGIAVKKIKIQPDEYWGPAEYTWSSDLSECTAKRTCKVDSSLVETETVKSTSKVTTPATTSVVGTTTYTATFTNKAFETQTKALNNIPTLAPSKPDPVNPDPETRGGSFEDFVERLYVVALNRASEPEGKAFWCEHVGNGDLNGAQCANEFLLSKEFNDRGLSDEEFLKVLYKTFFDRDAAADPDGFNFWMNSLKTEGRDKVVDGFINSEEWCNICATYGVKSGATRAKATIPSKNAKEFAERLYTKCLGRDAEEEGLMFWALGLTNLELTGKQAAHEFFFSKEFNDHNFDNKELLTRMYRTFMGREPDDDGMNFWLDSMKNGMTKEQVFDEFVKSAEFTGICKDYAIDRG